ncbi:MAG: glycosyltransferase family 4 protein [Verrucomicrobiota bacterium]
MRTASPHIVVGTNKWYLGGVNTYAQNLVDGFIQAGRSAELLLTNDPLAVEQAPLDRPNSIPFNELPKSNLSTWKRRWKRLDNYLSEKGSCIYLPNQDRAFSCASPMLSDSIKIVGVAHADEDYHYEHIERMGDYWNAIVCVSPLIAKNARSYFPKLADKIVSIPNSVPCPSKPPSRKVSETLRIIYAGRLSQYQKRILDIPSIVQALYRNDTNFEMTIAGQGKDEEELQKRIAVIDKGKRVRFVGTLANERVLKEFATHDVFLLTSDFEGLPVALVEAMARGCIPVVSRVKSGVTDLVKHNTNGLIFEIGDYKRCAELLATLSNDKEKKKTLSASSYEALKAGRFSQREQISNYLDLFRNLETQKRWKRIRGPAVRAQYFDPTLKGEIKRHVTRLLK